MMGLLNCHPAKSGKILWVLAENDPSKVDTVIDIAILIASALGAEIARIGARAGR